MKTSVHVYSSGFLGMLLYGKTHSMEISVAAFLSGIFIDIDHLFDFWFFAEEEISLRNFFSWCDSGKWEKISTIFHSYELYVLALVAAYLYPHGMLIGTLIGVGVHLVLDQVWNCHIRKNLRLSVYFYFLIYRVRVGFHKSRLRMW
jgi:hypothetical protein|tara:strand:+ start:2501 stop:2938 length:438 start_codon:yes stop_codon:yes gene_type:complete